GGPFEGSENENRSPVLMDAKQLTKWSNLKSTVASFSDGIKGVKVIRYSNYNPNFSTSVWQLLNRERTNTHAISKYSSNTSYINENGMEIPISLRKGIKVGEMFERPDNHELVRFAGWIEKDGARDFYENQLPEREYKKKGTFTINVSNSKDAKFLINKAKQLNILVVSKGSGQFDTGGSITFQGSEGDKRRLQESVEKTSSQKLAVKDNGEPEDDYNPEVYEEDTDDDLSNELVEDYKNKGNEEASIDIHVEAEPSVIEEILDTIMEGGDEELKGGLGDNKKDEEFDDEQLEKGKDVEKEHTDDEDMAKEIAKDHLTEKDDYYDKLEDMEKKESNLKKKSDSLKKFYIVCKYMNMRGEWGREFKKIEALSALEALKIVIDDGGEGGYSDEYINQYIEVNTPDEVSWCADPGDVAYGVALRKRDALFLAKSAIDDDYEESEDTFSSLHKKLDHYQDPNFGLWVASLGNSLQGEKKDQYHNILAQFLPEFGYDDYSEIVQNVDQLQVEQKKQLESHLYDLIGRQEFSSQKLSFDDPYDTQSDFHNDRGSYDQFLTPPDKELTIGDKVRVTEESTDMFGEEGVIADKLEFNSYRVNINGEDYRFYKDELTKIGSKTAAQDNINKFNAGDVVEFKDGGEVYTGEILDVNPTLGGCITYDIQDTNSSFPGGGISYDISEKQILRKISYKTAADISDQVPPMSNVTDESRTDSPAPNQQPLPPRQELNNMPGDVLYDSNQKEQGAGKFQVTTDPMEKTVTVKFLDQDKEQALNNLMGNPQQQPNPLMQPSQNPPALVPGQEGFQPQKDFQDTNSGVQF
ncbi:MAG: DUF5661 family protein, partial [Clostridia bacterium]